MTKASILSRLRVYYELTKPERTLSNVITAVAGFLFASQGDINWRPFTGLIIGTTLVIAAACVANNFVDKDLDKRMDRTSRRALVTGKVSKFSAFIYTAVLGMVGFAVLSLTNWLTVAIIATAFFSYVAVYGWAKRHTVHSTLIGTLPGGASLVAGYTAVTGRLDIAALLLYLIMLAWQMVHFHAIAIYRLRDYKAAKVPLLAVKQGIKTTKKHMVFYMGLFIFAVSLLTWAGYTGYIFLAAMLLISIIWLQKVLQGFSVRDDKLWARDVFKLSLIVLLAMSALLAIGPKLP